MPIVSEFDQFITSDGFAYALHAPDIRWVRSIEGTGMPPVTYLTQKGPFQHGETLLGYRLQPRVIQMLIRQNYTCRERYWHGRLQILDVLRPNRPGTTGTLRKNFGDGSKIDIDVVIQQGPNFEPADPDVWDEWSINEVIRFIAYNPVFYNPYLHTWDFINITLASGVAQDSLTMLQLKFAATFPINFNRNIGVPGIGGGAVAPTIDPNILAYLGSWVEYPTIILVGPLDSPFIITNVTTDETIRLNYVVDAGETVTIDLNYGTKTITSTLHPGDSLMGFLDPTSDVGSFHLQPGTNIFNTSILGQNANSRVQFKYNDRYVGY